MQEVLEFAGERHLPRLEGVTRFAAGYGGDGADLATGALCDLTLPAKTLLVNRFRSSS